MNRREERRIEQRKGGKRCSSCALELVSSPPSLPLVSISSWAPIGTDALARPQEPGSQNQAEGEKEGEENQRKR